MIIITAKIIFTENARKSNCVEHTNYEKFGISQISPKGEEQRKKPLEFFPSTGVIIRVRRTDPCEVGGGKYDAGFIFPGWQQ